VGGGGAPDKGPDVRSVPSNEAEFVKRLEGAKVKWTEQVIQIKQGSQGEKLRIEGTKLDKV